MTDPLPSFLRTRAMLLMEEMQQANAAANSAATALVAQARGPTPPCPGPGCRGDGPAPARAPGRASSRPSRRAAPAAARVEAPPRPPRTPARLPLPARGSASPRELASGAPPPLGRAFWALAPRPTPLPRRRPRRQRGTTRLSSPPSTISRFSNAVGSWTQARPRT
nr:uncharacterized protein LOC127340389 [Lolium perenne]